MSNDGNEIMGSGQDAAGHQVLGTAADGRRWRRWSRVNCVSLGPTTGTGLRLLPIRKVSKTSVPRLLLLLCHATHDRTQLILDTGLPFLSL